MTRYTRFAFFVLALVAALARVGGQAGKEEPEDAIRRLLDAGAYEQAERAAADLSDTVPRQAGAESLADARALDLRVEALIENGKAGASSTLAAATRAVEIRRRLQGSDHEDVAASLHRLGAVHVDRGEAAVALPLHERGLAIRTARLPGTDPAIAESHEYLAVALLQLERFDAVGQSLSRAQAIREAVAERDPLRLARVLTLQAWLNRGRGKYAAAFPFVDRALAIFKRAGPEHPGALSALEVRGDVLWLTSDITSAHTAWLDALKQSERLLRGGHPLQLALQRRLALAATAIGDRSEARARLENALSVAERSMAPCAPELAAMFGDLATTRWHDGAYNEAYTLNKRAYETYRRCLGPNHSYTATILYNQAGLASRVGDYAEAESLYNRAIQSWSASLKPNHAFVARGLTSLAQVVQSRGQYARAQALLKRALDIQVAAIGPDHPDVASTLTRLTSGSLWLRNLPAARQYADRARAILDKTTSDDPDHLPRLLLDYAEIDQDTGKYEEARASAAQALQLREATFGISHPLATTARKSLAAIDFALGRDSAAVTAALRAERDSRAQQRFTVRYLPERQGVMYADSLSRGLDVALSIAAVNRTDESGRILDEIIQSRSVLLDELAARSRLASQPDTAIGSANAALVQARQRYANLMLRSFTFDEAVPRKVLDDARQQKEDAERALAVLGGGDRSELEQASAGLESVRERLPEKAALISFVRYDRRSFPKVSRGVTFERKTPSYIAFILRKGQPEVSVVPLGTADSLDRLVEAWRSQVTAVVQASSPEEAERNYRTAGSALRRRVWDPLRASVAGSDTVFVVPDGMLNLVSFAALPAGQHRYLIEEGPVVHYLTAERDLISRSSPSDRLGEGLLAIGGAAFDDSSSFARRTKRTEGTKSAAESQSTAAALRSSSSDALRLGVPCGSYQSMHFQPLEGTRREVHEVASLWTGSPVRILENRNATERTFKREAAGHRVLHLATHGFFLGGPCKPAAPGTRSVGGLSASRSGGPARGLGETPLLLSGLALAGANQRAAAGPADEDGILTAEEVTALNLESVEWAVLSACDTGLGEVKVGEGVFGLRRAFQIAGVRTVIMSLWTVDDEAARLWMRALYERRFQRNLSTAQAMHGATLAALRDRRARGQSTHPFYWAAFVAVGDWH